MTEFLTAAQMRAIEAAAISSGQVTGLELMERAGAGVVAAVLEEWPELALTSHRAVVLCGPGNNGGDGFVVARLLAARGWAVEVFLYGDAGKLPLDARENYERWCTAAEVRGLTLCDVIEALFANAKTEVDFSTGAPLVIDAIFGTGLSRAAEADIPHILGLLADMVEFGHGAVVAVDVPSGICADSGKPLGAAASASLTVTFHRAKIGHFLSSGPANCGLLHLVDIGLAVPQASFVEKVDIHSQIGKSNGHKYSHGHALIVSGDHGHSGAARLAARGALRIGAGLATVASPLGAMAENAARLDAVMLKPVADAAAFSAILVDTRINALCLGPGMGLDPGAALLAVALGATQSEHAPKLVLDADALTLLSGDAGLFAQLNEHCILTPHGGEFGRLFPDIAERLAATATKGPAYSKVDAIREAAARAGCVVLYKGADTVIADPTGRCAINSAAYDRAAPWLATAGSGDVLAGFITGLLARGFAPFDAACTAAWLHVECARSFGPGLIAEDLPEELPKVFRALGV